MDTNKYIEIQGYIAEIWVYQRTVLEVRIYREQKYIFNIERSKEILYCCFEFITDKNRYEDMKIYG